MGAMDRKTDPALGILFAQPSRNGAGVDWVNERDPTEPADRQTKPAKGDLGERMRWGRLTHDWQQSLKPAPSAHVLRVVELVRVPAQRGRALAIRLTLPRATW